MKKTLLAVVLILTPSISIADTVCLAGNVSAIAGSTCSIGDLTFTFGGMNSSYGSMFYFTPTASGFTLSYLNGPVTASAPINYSVSTYALFPFSVVSQGGPITSMSVSGGQLDAGNNSGPPGSGFGTSGAGYYFVTSEWTDYSLSTIQSYSTLPAGSPGAAFCSEVNVGGFFYQPCSPVYDFSSPIQSGQFSAIPFYLVANNGANATSYGPSTTFEFQQSQVPEPGTLLLLTTGWAPLLALKRFRLISQRVFREL